MDVETASGWIGEHFAPWVQALGMRVERLACTGVVIQAPITPALAPDAGPVAAPVLTTLAQTAMTLACAGHFRGFRPVAPVTLETQFLRPARGDAISVTATIVRGGKALIFTRAVLTAEPSGQEVATATATFALP